MRLTRIGLSVALLVLWGGCGEEEPALEPTYENVADVMQRSCTFSVCHGAPDGAAGLDFDSTMDITTVLNGVASCQYDRMPRVDPGNPDNSWLMIKIEGPYDDMAQIQFTPAADWTSTATDPECESFGTLMPSTTMPTPLPMAEVEMIREWIRLGAPGPSGG